MKDSYVAGASFGIASAIITTLGLFIGLDVGTGSRLAVIGGILSIAFADAFSDALGMHISQESQKKHTVKGIWEATGATFAAKLTIALTFLVPVLLFDMSTAMVASVVWGLFALAVLSYFIAKKERAEPLHVIGEHLGIAVAVIIVTYIIGKFVASTFA